MGQWSAVLRYSSTPAGRLFHTSPFSWAYLAVMIDLHTRLVVGWSMKDRPNQELVNEALMMAVEQRRPKPGLIHHSDQGILYSSGSYLGLLQKYGMLSSMSGKGNCYDNAVAESFFSAFEE